MKLILAADSIERSTQIPWEHNISLVSLPMKINLNLLLQTSK